MKAHAPGTYDEITRSTVLEPDGSMRPLPSQHVAANTDAQLHDTVAEALISCGFTEIGVEVHDQHVVLRGWVDQPQHARLAARIAAAVAPEAVIEMRIRVA